MLVQSQFQTDFQEYVNQPGLSRLQAESHLLASFLILYIILIHFFLKIILFIILNDLYVFYTYTKSRYCINMCVYVYCVLLLLIIVFTVLFYMVKLNIIFCVLSVLPVMYE